MAPQPESGSFDRPSMLSLESLGLGGPSWGDASFSETLDSVQTSPQLVHQGISTAVYRVHDKGFKVILQPQPTEESVHRLLNEKRISDFLPSTCRKRRVIDITSFNRQPALSFKWVDGITLREWLKTAPFDSQASHNVRLRVGMAIAKTLSDFHNGGVVCNSLQPENVVLAPFEASGGECVATFIDLSRSLIYRDGDMVNFDAVTEKQVIKVDLRSLGMVLDEIFRKEDRATCEGEDSATREGIKYGVQDTQSDADHGRRKRGKQQTFRDGLPLYLSMLISALLENSTSQEMCYESAQDVFLDLKVLAEDSSGCFSKKQMGESSLKSCLRGGMFYGRQVQMSMILHLFQSTVSLGSQPLMAIISGYPGTGYVDSLAGVDIT